MAKLKMIVELTAAEANALAIAASNCRDYVLVGTEKVALKRALRKIGDTAVQVFGETLHDE